MNQLQRRVLGSSVTLARSGQVNGIDFDTLVQRLLLFDCYVLRTVRFKEVPYLIRALGYDQTLELLHSGLIQVRCEVTQIASERDAELKRLRKPTFSLIWIEAHDWEKYVSDCLADVRAEVSVPEDKWQTLESAIRACIRRVDTPIRKEFGLSFISSITTARDVVTESVRMAGRKRRIPMVLPNFEISVEQNGDLIEIGSDLYRRRIPQEELWETLRDGLMGVAVLEQNIGEMKNYAAIGGFSLEELPVFQTKLSGLADAVFPGHTERRVTRVAKLIGLPQFDPEKIRLNVSKLFRARESDDLRAFRDWLATSDGVPDDEVRQLLTGYRAVVSTFVRGGSVTMVRLVVEGMAGWMHPVLGLALPALDTFIVEKLLPHSGPAAFVGKTFSSLYDKRKIKTAAG